MNNSTLTKAEVIDILASQTNNPKKVVKAVLENLFKTVSHSLSTGRRIELRGFGVWEVRMSKARVGRNPNKPEAGPITIPSRPVVRFKLGKELASAVANLRANTPTPEANV